MYSIFHVAKVKNKTARTKKKWLIVDDRALSFSHDSLREPICDHALMKWGWFSSPKRGLKMKPSSENAVSAVGSWSWF